MIVDYERKDYRQLAKELGVIYLFGRWALQVRFDFRSKNPRGRPIQLIPLDGWVTDTKEVERTMRERGLEI